jgi:hypothetical protein
MDDLTREMAAFIRTQRASFSDTAIRDRLEKDGMSHAQIESAFVEAGPLEEPNFSLSVRGRGPVWRKWGVGALIGALLAGGYILIKGSKNKVEFKSRTGSAPQVQTAP